MSTNFYKEIFNYNFNKILTNYESKTTTYFITQFFG